MDLENLDTTLQIRETELNLTIKTTRAGKCGVQGVRAICCHEDLYISARVETIKLVNNLKHCALYF
jgi:hypothetical protein